MIQVKVLQVSLGKLGLFYCVFFLEWIFFQFYPLTIYRLIENRVL